MRWLALGANCKVERCLVLHVRCTWCEQLLRSLIRTPDRQLRFDDLEPLHSVWLCSQLTTIPPDVREFHEHRRKTLLLQLPTQHTSTATADNGRQITYLMLYHNRISSRRNHLWLL